MNYLPRIDEGACIAQGDCVDTAPEAAENCPVEAITLVNAVTGEQVYP